MTEVKHHKRQGRLPKIEVVDLFCGIGGLSYGMKSAGFDILAGYDLDWTCQYAYETNTGGKFFYKDVKEVTGDEIQALYSNKNYHLCTCWLRSLSAFFFICVQKERKRLR